MTFKKDFLWKEDRSSEIGIAMIDHWHSMMDNLSDIYYLLQLIIRQTFIYLRDLIHYKFFWLTVNTDDFEASESKLRNLTTKNITADILAFAILCAVLFLLVMLASKCEKDKQQCTSTDTETIQQHSAIRGSEDLQEDPYCVANANSRSSTYFHACGDSICTRGRFKKRNFSDEDISRVRSSRRSSNASIPKKSIFGLNTSQPHSSQSTQTTDKMFHQIAEKWLVRRTRSGHIYGKYPI